MDSASPRTVYQEAVGNYVSVGVLAVLTWDILENIPSDYRILFSGKHRKKLSVPTIVYILSRLGAFLYALLSVIFDTAPIGHCNLLHTMALAWCPFSFGATEFLFFLRLRAVYNRDRVLVSTFFVLWLAVLVGASLSPIGSHGAELLGADKLPTGYCKEIEITGIAAYGLLAPLGYDTLVLIAISWRVARIADIDDPNPQRVAKSVNTMFFGTNLPAFAKALLRDGQIYYLIVVLTGIACAILLFSPLVPAPLSGLLAEAYPMLINIMACRVFRHTKSGLIRESEISTSCTNQIRHGAPLQFASAPGLSSEITQDYH